MLLPHTKPPPFELLAPSELASRLPGHPGAGVSPLQARGVCAYVDYGPIRPGVVPRNAGTDLLTAVARPHNFHVISVLVQAGMTRLCTGAVIVHELMRAYLRMCGVRSLTEATRDVEAGLCNLMGYLWLDCQSPQVRRAFTHTKCLQLRSCDPLLRRFVTHTKSLGSASKLYTHVLTLDASPQGLEHRCFALKAVVMRWCLHPCARNHAAEHL